MAAKLIKWHRLFGIALTDYFTNTGYEVELEIDLSLKRQIVDVIVIQRNAEQPLVEVCDGFEVLGEHNLVTYKSMRESLTAYALEELVGHGVNYRKVMVDRTGNRKLADVQLFAICTRAPRKLASQVPWTSVAPGIYDVPVLTRQIRVIVLSQISGEARNALWAPRR